MGRSIMLVLLLPPSLLPDTPSSVHYRCERLPPRGTAVHARCSVCVSYPLNPHPTPNLHPIQVRTLFGEQRLEMWAVGASAGYRLHLPRLYGRVIPKKCSVKVNQVWSVDWGDACVGISACVHWCLVGEAGPSGELGRHTSLATVLLAPT